MTVVAGGCGHHHESSPLKLGRSKKTRAAAAVRIPTIDLSLDRWKVSQLIVKACQEFGFFKLINHGVPHHIISRLERESVDFFAKPAAEKHKAGPPTPFGYGCKNIGYHGDKGELEYLLLEANPASINQRSFAISDRPKLFSCAANEYVGQVRKLVCDILDLAEEGLYTWGIRRRRRCNRAEEEEEESSGLIVVLSKLIRDANNDSCFRINHYPPAAPAAEDHDDQTRRLGFGEHSDPQILTILRSNEVPGLQICTPDGLWIPVTPDPAQFCVFVGDAFQALTNGRFRSVRHRVVQPQPQPAMAIAMANSVGNNKAAAAATTRSRMSTIYFGAPPLDAWISPLPHTVSARNPSLYRPFTWGEFKKVVYSSRLADNRLHLFKS